MPFADLTNPQTLNLYQFVGNNPETLTDAMGHAIEAMSTPPPGCFLNACSETTMLYGDRGSALPDPVPDQDPPQANQNGQQPATQQQAQNQNQQKYDPSKTGPEDPTNPGKPLYQNAVVKKASDQAFMTTTNGQAREGLAEAGFAIEYKDGKISLDHKTDTVHGDGKPNELHITTDANTIAILHTHGNKALAAPSPGDLKSPVPNFVRSQRELYVTVPGTTKYIQLVPAPSN